MAKSNRINTDGFNSDRIFIISDSQGRYVGTIRDMSRAFSLAGMGYQIKLETPSYIRLVVNKVNKVSRDNAGSIMP